MKNRFTDGQIIGFLKESEAGTSVEELVASTGSLMRRSMAGEAGLAAWSWQTLRGCAI